MFDGNEPIYAAIYDKQTAEAMVKVANHIYDMIEKVYTQ